MRELKERFKALNDIEPPEDVRRGAGLLGREGAPLRDLDAPQRSSRLRRVGTVVVALVVAGAGLAIAAPALRLGHDEVLPAATEPPGSEIALLIGNKDQSSSLAVIRPDATGLSALTTGGEPDQYAQKYGYVEESDPNWSSDGKTIAFTRWYGGDKLSLCEINADGSGFRVIVRDFAGGQVSWSPDGSTFAYAADGGIRLIDSKGENDRAVPNLPVPSPDDPPNWLPAWSPDSTHLVFTSRDVWTIGVDGSDLTRVTHLIPDQAAFDAAWSPDGTKIAFSLGTWKTQGDGGYQSGGEIYLVNADGTDLHQLTTDAMGDWIKVAWSPDGTQLAATKHANGGGSQGLWVMNADGTDLHEVLDGDVRETFGTVIGPPDWHTVSSA